MLVTHSIGMELRCEVNSFDISQEGMLLLGVLVVGFGWVDGCCTVSCQ